MLLHWVKKLHMYAGLLSYTAFLVWGVTGIHAVFLPSPENWRQPEPEAVKRISWEAPGNLDDKALAAKALEASGLRMVGAPVLHHRDAEQNLTFAVFGLNGRRDLTYLEAERTIRVDYRQSNLGEFLSAAHTNSTRRGPPDFAARVWGVYNEFSVIAFVFMTFSGVYLWLATRPRLGWAWITFGAAGVVFAALWMATR